MGTYACVPWATVTRGESHKQFETDLELIGLGWLCMRAFRGRLSLVAPRSNWEAIVVKEGSVAEALFYHNSLIQARSDLNRSYNIL